MIFDMLFLQASIPSSLSSCQLIPFDLSLQRRKLPQKVAGTLVTTWVSIQILLVICLRIPPLPSRQDLRNDLPLPPLLIHGLSDFPSDALLLGIMVKDARAILRATVGALLVGSCGVVHLVEEFEELGVGYL